MRFITTVCILFAAVGCRSLPNRSLAAHADKPAETDRVSRAVALWSEAVLRQASVPVAQGFAAKVYLYGPDSDRPVAGHGKVTVYAYDDSNLHQAGDDSNVRQAGAKEPNPKPDQSWEFKQDELRRLLRKDLIGWYYPLWLPCGPPAAGERRHTLILCFTPASGSPVLTEPTLVTLPAIRPAGQSAAPP